MLDTIMFTFMCCNLHNVLNAFHMTRRASNTSIVPASVAAAAAAAVVRRVVHNSSVLIALVYRTPVGWGFAFANEANDGGDGAGELVL